MSAARANGAKVAFVPTMGALHDGHLSLVRRAKREASLVVVSVFVNPTQFGPNEDFARYPRDLAADHAKLEAEGVDLVLAPAAEALYPEGESTRVSVGMLDQHLCGPLRPGHFEGVATVLAKLFSVVGPCVAVFGKKDYQQVQVVRRMVRDLLMPVQVSVHPIVREADGLAMSSRNAYLEPAQRVVALSLSRGLRRVDAAHRAGERNVARLQATLDAELGGLDSVDYAVLADADSLVPLQPDAALGERTLVAIAGHVGRTRLIDNLVLGEDSLEGAP